MSEFFDSCLYFRLNRILRTLTQHADAAFAQHKLSSSYAYLLILVGNNPKIGTVDLSNELNLSPSTVTRLVDKMVAQGYLERVKDGKRCEISCTEVGTAMAVELLQTWQKFQQDMSKQVGDEVYNGLNSELKKLEEKVN
ncbi:MAG: MarR family winged helix-turn-helix transcriptional regulator [Mangrovibacterium sp.]